MIEYVEQMLRVILGDYFFTTYSWSTDFLNIMIFIFAVLIIIITYNLWKYLIVGWWRDL